MAAENAAYASSQDLHFRYRKAPALTGVTLTIGPGVTGVLGPNGAGKTTLISIFSTLLTGFDGSATLAGNDLATASGRRAARRSLGYLPQTFDVMDTARVRDNVEYSAWARGVPEERCQIAAEHALQAVDLLDRSHDRARRLSGGMRQRLGLACAIAHRPKILLLDEPTVGLDPEQRVRIRTLLHELGRKTAVLLSTHLVEDVASAADRVLVMNQGRLVFSGSTREFINQGSASAVSSASEEAYRSVLTHSDDAV